MAVSPPSCPTFFPLSLLKCHSGSRTLPSTKLVRTSYHCGESLSIATATSTRNTMVTLLVEIPRTAWSMRSAVTSPSSIVPGVLDEFPECVAGTRIDSNKKRERVRVWEVLHSTHNDKQMKTNKQTTECEQKKVFSTNQDGDAGCRFAGEIGRSVRNYVLKGAFGSLTTNQ